MILGATDREWLRWSLVLVWLATALASLWELDGQSLRLLASAGIDDPTLARRIIYAGIVVDAALGLALWLKPGRASYLAALGAMGAMTLIATLLQPELWLHPLGPLTKNAPIAVALVVLSRRAP